MSHELHKDVLVDAGAGTFELYGFAGGTASYAVSVRRAGILPAASFGFHLAMDTLAVRLAVPVIRVLRGLAPQVTNQAPYLIAWRLRATRHAWRTQKNACLLAKTGARSHEMGEHSLGGLAIHEADPWLCGTGLLQLCYYR